MAGDWPQAVRASYRDECRWRMYVGTEGFPTHTLEQVPGCKSESCPPRPARVGEDELLRGVGGGRSDEGLVVGVTANDLVENDDIRRVHDFRGTAKSIRRRSTRPSNPAVCTSSAAYGS